MGRVLQLGATVVTSVTFVHSLASAESTSRPASGVAPAPIQVVVTGTRTPEASTRSILQTGVVTRQDATRRGATSVAEALEGEPTLQVGAGNYDERGNPAGIQMQGLDAERVLILRDGERVVGDSGGVVDLSNFAIADLERVEYVVGPSSALYGTGALGGVVNLISGPPQIMGTSGTIRLEGRSLPLGMLGANLAHRADHHWLGISGTERLSAGVRAEPDLPDLMLPASQRLELGLRGGHEGQGVDTVAQANLSFNDSDGLTSQQIPGLARYFTDLPDRNRRVHLQLFQNYDVNSNTRLRWSSSGQQFAGTNKKDRRDSLLDEVRDRDQMLLATETVLTTTRDNTTWVAGLRFERETFAQDLSKTTASAGALETTTEAEVAPVLLQSGAAFAQVTWQPTRRLTVLPGARAELHRHYGATIAPRLALALRPNSDLTLRVSSGRGFRVPSAKEFGFLFDHSALGYRVIGNPNLDPEQSWGLQGDVSYAVDAHTRVRVGGYRNWISSMISTEFVGQSALGVDDYAYVNVGRAITSGFDAQTTYTLGETLRAQWAYSYLYTLNQDDQAPLPKRPPHTLTASIDYEFWPKWRLTTRVRGTSNAYLTAELTTPGYVRADLRLERSLGTTLSVHLGVLDLLDSQRDANRLGDTRPLIGRQFYAGLVGQWPGTDS